MKAQSKMPLQIEPLEDRIAPSGLGACLSITPPAEQAHATEHSVAAAAMAANGRGVVTVEEGLCD